MHFFGDFRPKRSILGLFLGGGGSKFTLKKLKPFRPRDPPEILDHHTIPLITILPSSRLLLILLS